MKLMRWNGNELDWNEAGEMEWKWDELGMKLVRWNGNQLDWE